MRELRDADHELTPAQRETLERLRVVALAPVAPTAERVRATITTCAAMKRAQQQTLAIVRQQTATVRAQTEAMAREHTALIRERIQRQTRAFATMKASTQRRPQLAFDARRMRQPRCDGRRRRMRAIRPAQAGGVLCGSRRGPPRPGDDPERHDDVAARHRRRAA